MTARSETHCIVLNGPDAGVQVSVPRVLARIGCQVRAHRRRVLRDSYLDTDDWLLHRAGAVLRLRTGGGRPALGLGLLNPAAEAPEDPGEFQEALDAVGNRRPGPVPGSRLRDRLAPVLRGAPVRARLRVRRECHQYDVSGPGGQSFTVLADAVRLAGRRGGAAWAEVALTTAAAAGPTSAFAKAADALAAGLGLERSDRSALTRALSRAGIEPPRLAEGEEVTLRPEDRFVDAAYRVCHRHFRRMVWNEPGTRLGLDAERLHDMRVAARRLRSALRAFRAAIPARKYQGLCRQLRWLRAALGRVRDLDVHLLRLRKEGRRVKASLRPAMELHADHLHSRRCRARVAMLRALDSKRYAAFVEDTDAWLAVGPPAEPQIPAAGASVLAAARKLVLKRLRRVLKAGRAAGPHSSDRALHKLRIRCKRLRYACEFFSDLYGPPAVRFGRRVRRLQDILGEHQDAVVAREALAESAAGSEEGPRPRP